MNKTKALIDELILKRSKGMESLAISTRMKLLMKGIDAKKINADTVDNEETIKKIYQVAKELNINLSLN